MKRKIISALLVAAMMTTMLIGCGSSEAPTTDETVTEEAGGDEAPAEEAGGDEAPAEAAGGDKTFAIITKSAGNPYNDREASGFEEVITQAGYNAIVKHPETASAEAQITVINELVAQQVDAIAIAGNDFDALQPALKAAMDKGIKVSSVDANVNPESRAVFVNQAGVKEIASGLMDGIHEIAGGSGEYAILSATANATNQNAWIDAMKELQDNDDKYKDLTLVEVAYGDDEPQKSADETQALLQKYPDLKVICAPTTVGIAAGAKTLQDADTDVLMTGLGLPSEMADYIGDDKVCPFMYLWNPIDVGRLSAYTSIALVDGEITGATGDQFTAGDMGDYTVVEAGDGGTEIIVGPPFAFTPENINDWKDVY